MRWVYSVLLYVLLFCSYSSSAQPINQYVNDIVMPTPNAAALGQYIDVPVNYFTGTPSINIPIYTAQDGNLKDAISLSNHASGIKAIQQASWVGLGWNLNAGGMVTRTVQGLHDTDVDGYWFYDTRLDFYSGTTGSFISACDQLGPDDVYVTDIADGNLDGESDIYSFTVPGGYSGKFVIDKNKKAKLIPRQDIKIELIYSSPYITNIIITTPDGVDYFFGNTLGGSENAYDLQTAGGVSYIANWHLVRASSFDGLYNIDYNYMSDTYDYRVPKSNTIEYAYDSGSGQTGDNFNINNSYSTIAINGKKLSSIVTESETISFTSALGRSDLINSEALERITINTGGFCKRFDLDYNYFTEGTSGLLEEDYKLKLDSVQERSCNTSVTDIPAYSFDYYGTVQSNSKIYFPGMLSKQTDHWGFFNGQSGNDSKSINIPSTKLLSCSGVEYTEGSANRNVNTTKVIDGSLKKITYPTGGSTTFAYEAHDAQFYSNTINQTLKFYLETCGTPGPACCGDKDSTITSSFTALEVSGSVTFHIELTRNEQPPPDDCPSFVSTDILVVLAGDTIGSLGFNLETGENYKEFEDISIDELVGYNNLMSGVNYTFILNTTNGRAQFRVHTAEFGLDTKDVGGIRIQEIKQHDGIDASRDILYQYEYLDPANPAESSGLLLGEPTYGYKYQGTAGPNGGSSSLCLLHFSDTPSVPLGDFEGHHIAYKHVKEIHVGNGHKEFKYNLSISNAYYEAVGGKYMSLPIPLDKSKGFLLESSIHHSVSTPNLIQKTTNSPTSEPDSAVIGVLVRAQKTNCQIGGINGHTFWRQYALETARKARLEQEITFLDGVSTTTSYTYDSLDRFTPVVASTMTNSDGKKFYTLYTYPHDVTGTANNALITHNIIAPLHTEQRVGDIITTATKTDKLYTEYSLFTTANGSFPYPSRYARDEVTWSPGYDTSASNITLATIGSYDNSTGNPSSVTIDGWEDLNYTWNTNGTMQTKEFEGFQTRYKYHGSSRLLSGVKNIDNTSHGFEYDEVMRLKTIRDSCRNKLTTLEYNFGSPSGGNFIKTTIDYDQVVNSNLNLIVDRQYVDGLGRPTQYVKEKQGPTATQDIYKVTNYDNRGRPMYETELTALTDQNGAYQNETTSNTWDKLTYTYEASPLNRPISTIHTAWPYRDSIYYGSNSIIIDGLGMSQLFEIIQVDGDGRRSIAYKDKRGRLIASSLTGENGALPLTTISRYDDKDRRTMIIPPGAISSDANLIYTYQYYGNDLIQFKKIPDRMKIEYRYNNRDLLNHYQDGFLKSRTLKPWLATNYDAYGRPLKTGYSDDQGNNLSSDPTIIDIDRLSVTTYYQPTDTHKDKIETYEVAILEPNGNLNSELLSSEYVYDKCGRDSIVKSETLLSLTNINNLTHQYLYDGADNLLVDEHRQLILGNHNFDVVRTVDFAGRPEFVHQTFDGLGTQTISKTTYTEKNQIASHQLGLVSGNNYLQSCDYTYRGNKFLKKINNVLPSNNDLFHLELKYDTILSASEGHIQMNGNIAQVLSQVTGIDRQSFGLRYDEYNRLKYAFYRTFNNGGGFESLNDYNTSYTYDERGNIKTLVRNGLYPEDSVFEEGQIDNLMISHISGTNKINTIVDNGTSPQKSRGAKSSNGNSYGYDDNGNIIFDPTREDSITYNHLNLPSKIDFLDGRIIEFTYDTDGRQLRKEAKQGLASIENRYYIDGAEYKDNQLVQLMHDEGRVAKSEPCDQNQYIGGILDNTDQYHGDHIISNSSVIPTGLTEFKADQSIILNEFFEVSFGKEFEAEIVPCSTSNWQYEYALRDHLGNTRVVFADIDSSGLIDPNTEILYEGNYYPFGMEMEGPWQERKKQDYNYRYNGKELHPDFGLGWINYGARFYDPAIGRFTGVDPISDKFPHVSTYNYAENKPINSIDLWGLQAWNVNGGIINGPFANQAAAEKKAASNALTGLLSFGAYTEIQSEVVRVEYGKTTSKLDPSDSAGRTKAKSEARAKTPSLTKTIVESARPSLEGSTSTGSANKTNAGWNKAAGTLGTAGKAAGAAGVVFAGYNIATAEDKSKAVATEGGAIVGGIAGGETGAVMGAAIGVWFGGAGAVPGAFVGAIVGSIGGSIGGAKAAEAIHDAIENKEDD